LSETQPSQLRQRTSLMVTDSTSALRAADCSETYCRVGASHSFFCSTGGAVMSIEAYLGKRSGRLPVRFTTRQGPHGGISLTEVLGPSARSVAPGFTPSCVGSVGPRDRRAGTQTGVDRHPIRSKVVHSSDRTCTGLRLHKGRPNPAGPVDRVPQRETIDPNWPPRPSKGPGCRIRIWTSTQSAMLPQNATAVVCARIESSNVRREPRVLMSCRMRQTQHRAGDRACWGDRYSPVLAPRCEELECDVVRVSKGQCRVPGRVHDATAGDAEFV